MKIANPDDMIRVYCRVTNLEPNMQYSGCLNILNKTTLELVVQQDTKADEIFGKKDKLINSPNISKELFQCKPEVIKSTEKFVFDYIFKESDSFEEIHNSLNLNLDCNHCLVSIRQSDFFSSKSGLILLNLRKALEKGYTVKVGMAKINLGSSQSVFKGYKIIENYVEGFKLFVQTEYFTEQKTRDDAYVTTLVLVKDNNRSYLQFADISQLSKNTDVLAKILTDSEYNKNGNQQAGNHLIQILSKSICFGGSVLIFGHIQGISPYINANRHTLYFMDHLYKNRGKSRNAYSELLLAEIIKLQKNNMRLKEKVQSSTQIYLTQEQLVKENSFLKNKRLETILECKEETLENHEDSTEKLKCPKECNEMFTKIQDQNLDLENNVKELKNELVGLRNIEKNHLNDLNSLKMKNKELEDELAFIKRFNPENSSKIIEDKVKANEKLVKISDENFKLKEKLENAESCIRKATSDLKFSPETDLIHKHYYEIMAAQAHLYHDYEELMKFKLEEIYDLYSSVVDRFNEEVRESHASGKQKSSELQNEIKDMKGKLMENSHELQEKTKEIEMKQNEIKTKNDEIKAKNNEIKEKNDEIKAKNQEINAKNQEIEAKNKEINAKDQDIQKILLDNFDIVEQPKEVKSHELKKLFSNKLEDVKKKHTDEVEEKNNLIQELEKKNQTSELKIKNYKSEILNLREKIKKSEEDSARHTIKYTKLKENYNIVKKMAQGPVRKK